MSGTDSEIQWFIARDGKQHGPLSEPEMRKLVELSHLRPTDLVWRLGFPDWRPAHSVFPPASAPELAPTPPAPAPAQAPAAATPRREEPVRPQAAPASATPNPSLYPQPQPYSAPRELRVDQPATRPLGTPYRSSSMPEPALSAGPGHSGPGQMASGHMGSAHMGSPAQQPYFPTPADEPEPERRGGGIRRAFTVLLLLGILAGGGYYGYMYKDLVLAAVRSLTASTGGTPVPVVSAPDGETKTPASENQSATYAATAVTSPATSSSTAPEFLNRPLWASVKQEFPEWYDARVAEVSHLSAEGKSNDEIIHHLVQALVTLRRENSQAALAASTEKHRELATAFLNNLKQLAGESGDGCYDFISKGETSPFIIARMADPEKSANIDSQVITIISAISEGKKSPVAHTSPVKADYDVLAGELTRLGWTQQDMALFADPRALARAPRDRVCKMLQDWFTAHLAIPDRAVQDRLLFETLKPVVSG